MADLAALERLSAGFRGQYLRHDAVASQLRAWAAAFPALCSVRSIGETLEGREILLLSIDRDPSRRRPAAWVDGNMHAQELCGSSVALAIAEDVLRPHLGGDARGLPAHVVETLRDVVFHVLPRMCPDGAEAVLREGRYVRSNPRDRLPHAKPRWVGRDVDGDGVALVMRKEDPAGELTASRVHDGLLVPRTLEDEGPFYKVFPEGMIEPFDGATIPDPSLFGDNDTDLNRNFPYAWMPEPEQAGAGAYPASEPESRAVVAFANAHPEIYAWLNLHTFGGVYIRPLGNAADAKMDPEDLAVFRQLAAWGEEHGGYPTVSGFEEFLYEPGKPLHGDLTDFAYHQRGAVAVVCELWDLFAQVGIERKKPFVATYSHLGREELERMARWDAEHNSGRVVRPWRAFDHPQLGAVELGGLDPRVGMVNPPYEKLAEVCARQSAFFLRVAAMAPRVSVRATHEPLGDGLVQLTIVVENRGYLPTHVLSSSKKLPWNEPVFLDVETAGAALVDPADAHLEIGHLAGWGRGLYGTMSASAFFQRTSGSTSSRTVRVVVKGTGRVTLRASSPRAGDATLELTV